MLQSILVWLTVLFHMIGVALQEEPSLGVHHLHMILHPTTLCSLIVCFPDCRVLAKGNNLASVVDPGVGSSRKVWLL